MKYLIFSLTQLLKNEATFNAWNRIANKFYEYPNYYTQQYTAPIYHPDNNQVAFPMLDNAVSPSGQISFRGKISFALNIVDELEPDWFITPIRPE